MDIWGTYVFAGTLAVGIYALSKFLEDRGVRSAYNQIIDWSRNRQRIKSATGCESFEEWLESLPEITLSSDQRLAEEALFCASVRPFGVVKGEQVARLGYRLHAAWESLIWEVKKKRLRSHEEGSAQQSVVPRS